MERVHRLFGAEVTMKFQTLLITAVCTTGTQWMTARGLCPSGWHVPTDGEFMTLEMELGMSESEANGTGWRGTDQGTQMKSSASDSPAWNGTNTSGFSGLAGGYRYTMGTSLWRQLRLFLVGFGLRSIRLVPYWMVVTLKSSDNYNLRDGFSVRCVRD